MSRNASPRWKICGCSWVGNASNDIIAIARASADENTVVPDTAARLPIAVLSLGIPFCWELETISDQSMREITLRPTYPFLTHIWLCQSHDIFLRPEEIKTHYLPNLYGLTQPRYPLLYLRQVYSGHCWIEAPLHTSISFSDLVECLLFFVSSEYYVAVSSVSGKMPNNNQSTLLTHCFKCRRYYSEIEEAI